MYAMAGDGGRLQEITAPRLYLRRLALLEIRHVGRLSLRTLGATVHPPEASADKPRHSSESPACGYGSRHSYMKNLMKIARTHRHQ